MSKKDWWEDIPIHHVEDEYAWAYEDDDEESDEPDESYGADDYISSRPWGLDNEGL